MHGSGPRDPGGRGTEGAGAVVVSSRGARCGRRAVPGRRWWWGWLVVVGGAGAGRRSATALATTILAPADDRARRRGESLEEAESGHSGDSTRPRGRNL